MFHAKLTTNVIVKGYIVNYISSLYNLYFIYFKIINCYLQILSYFLQTIPRGFVQAHNLHRFERVQVYTNEDVYSMEVIVYPERRYTQFGTHASANVVLKGKWADLKKKCGFQKDKNMTFELTYLCSHPTYVALFKLY